MSVLRKILDQRFTVVPNELLNDETLDLAGKAIVILMLSKPDDWSFSAERLARELPEGRDAIRSAMNRAEASGWVLRRDVRHLDGTLHREVRVRNNRQLSWDSGGPADDGHGEVGDADFGATVAVSNTELARTDLPRTEKSLESHVRSLARQDGEPTPFDAFYSLFPRHVARPDAERAWRKAITRAPAGIIIEGAIRYRDDPNRDDSFTAHPATWLNRDGWNDDPLPPRQVPLRHHDRAAEIIREAMSESDPGEGGVGDPFRGVSS